MHAALHAYACDCITHHLFHPNGSDCLGKKEDEAMMHQVGRAMQRQVANKVAGKIVRGILGGLFRGR